MKKLDELILACNTAEDWEGQMLEHRKEIIELQRRQKAITTYGKVRRFSGLANVIKRILGFSLIYSALIHDIDLGVDGTGALETIYGG